MAPTKRRLRSTAILSLWLVCGCQHAGGGLGPDRAPDSPSQGALRGLDRTHWSWVEAECSDGPLELGRVGLDRELDLSVTARGVLEMVFETELATEGCYTSAEWSGKPMRDGLWRFKPRALVTLPPDAECGAVDRETKRGSLGVVGDRLEMVTHASAWCRGFDARFVYRRAPRLRLSDRQIVTRYTGAFNRRDAGRMAELFAEHASLVEPFSRTDDGNYLRHEGREAIRAWYASAFGSVPWLGMRLTAISPGDSPGHLIADWEYMDPQLAEPLRGRTLLVIAAGEIFEAEVQLVNDPKPVTDAPALGETAADE
jgi:hypothetical protein